MIIDNIYKSLIVWIKTEKQNSTVVKMYQNSPRPKNNYFGLYISTNIQKNDDYKTYDTNTNEQKTYSTEEYKLDINKYGVDAFEDLKSLMSTLKKNSIREQLRKLGIVVVNYEDAIDITENIDGRYEERAICNMKIRCDNTIIDNITFFDKVEIGDNIVVMLNNTEENIGKINIP